MATFNLPQQDLTGRNLQTPQRSAAPTAPVAPAPAHTPSTPAHAEGTSATNAQVGNLRGTPPRPSAPGQPNAALNGQAAAANEARGTVLTKPHDIIEHELSAKPELRKAYEKLSPADRSKFDGLLNSQVVDGTKVDTKPQNPLAGGYGGGGYPGGGMFGGMAGGKPPTPEEAKKQQAEAKKNSEIWGGNGARQGLYSMLETGSLGKKDSQGHTLLDNLSTLQHQKFAPGVDGKEVLRETIGSTTPPPQGCPPFMPNSPGATVASTQLQQEMAKSHPAEYARLMAGLSSPQGEATLADGVKVQRDPNSVADDKSTRPQGSRIFQEAVHGVANKELNRVLLDARPEAKKAYEALTPAQRKEFDDLREAQSPDTRIPMPKPQPANLPGGMMGGFGGIGGFGDGGEFQKGIDRQQNLNNLYEVLGDGRMKQTDAKGQTLLHNLHTLNTQEVAPGIDRDKFFNEALNHVADPSSINQLNHGTCTVTTLEHINASRQPAEFVRILEGLASKQGSVQLRDGETLNRNPGSIADDHSGRTSVNRIYQATMMDFANGAEGYDNSKDSHTTPDGKPLLTRRGEFQSGLYDAQWKKALDAVLPGHYDSHEFKHENGPLTAGFGVLLPGLGASVGRMVGNQISEATAGSAISAELARGQDVPVSMKWGKDKHGDTGYHALQVNRMDDKYVYLHNPWGFGENGNKDPNNGPIRESLAGTFDHPGTGKAGDFRMTKAEFYANLQSYFTQTGNE